MKEIGNKSMIFILLFMIFATITVFYLGNSLLNRISIYENTIEVSDEVIKIADEIKEYCIENYDESALEICYEWEVERRVVTENEYVIDDILSEPFNLNNNPDYTLENGNDCEGKAILALSILKALNVSKLYFVIQISEELFGGGHACWGVNNNHYTRFYNCMDELIYSEIELVS